jgi:hypothetical protein
LPPCTSLTGTCSGEIIGQPRRQNHGSPSSMEGQLGDER